MPQVRVDVPIPLYWCDNNKPYTTELLIGVPTTMPHDIELALFDYNNALHTADLPPQITHFELRSHVDGHVLFDDTGNPTAEEIKRLKAEWNNQFTKPRRFAFLQRLWSALVRFAQGNQQ